MVKILKHTAIAGVRFYQIAISPLFPPSCRHQPSCSQYMAEAIKEWGVGRGIMMGLKRLSRCHPWGTSGYDPVPKKVNNGNLDNDMIERTELEEGLQFIPQFVKRGGLLPVAVQETATGQLLMLAFVNEQALHQTMNTGLATFWSTSRNRLWVKGETSGDYLKVDNILVDCDQDALVYQVTLRGAGVCHTLDSQGIHRKACFYRVLDTEHNKLQFIENMQ